MLNYQYIHTVCTHSDDKGYLAQGVYSFFTLIIYSLIVPDSNDSVVKGLQNLNEK